MRTEDRDLDVTFSEIKGIEAFVCGQIKRCSA